ncbi:site-specific DNA-methyltransferase [Micrococcus yunnanensis]|nr:site-specific DNA-methyltransferase [Micrococcus yunnanensis]TFU54678.1 site-specific DNA-methyltransferase [Micrococcus yunnanensis]
MSMEPVRRTSPDLIADNVRRLAELFPSVITETRDDAGDVCLAVDFDLLRQELSDHVVEGPQERYQLDWPGKRAAAFAANAPTTATLRPDREESVNFDTTKNVFIEGDNLEVLKVLQESYLGKIDAIYIDPPYNTGDDLIYNDDFKTSAHEYLVNAAEIDNNGYRLRSNTTADGRFHTNWLNMLYPRLRVARNLLSDTGVIFISIGDSEVAQLRLLCDNVFGRSNFIAQITVEISTTQGMKVRAAQNGKIVKNSEFVLVYSRGAGFSTTRRTPLYDPVSGWPGNFGTWLHDDLTFEPLTAFLNRQKDLVKDAQRITGNATIRTTDLDTLLYASPVFKEFVEGHLNNIAASDKGIIPDGAEQPEWEEGRAFEVQGSERSYILMKSSKGTVRQFLRMSDNYRTADDYWSTLGRTVIRGDLWKGFYSDMAHVSLEGSTPFENGKKPARLIENLLKWANLGRNALVLDFFAGSGTTGQAVMNMNSLDNGRRRFILVQLPETPEARSTTAKAGFSRISDLTRERLRRAGNAVTDSADRDDLDIGFRAYRLDASPFAEKAFTPENTTPDLLAELEDPILPDRTPGDLLTHVLLAWGLDLAVNIRTVELAGQRVFDVEDGALLAAFGGEVTDELAEAMARREPARAVFLDSGFISDAARINVEQIFREISPSTDVKVL